MRFSDYVFDFLGVRFIPIIEAPENIPPVNIETMVLAPPFPAFAIETSLAEADLCILSFATHDDQMSSYDEEMYWMYRFRCYVGRRHAVGLMPPEGFISVAENGHFNRAEFHQVDEYNGKLGQGNIELTEKAFDILTSAITLMNCRNVEMVDEPLPRHVRRQNERIEKGKSGIYQHEYKVLKIKGDQKIYESSEDTEEGGKRKLHVARGHFKTYTEDAPLFGRLTGTYYWGPQLRGDAQKGIIHKDYEVEID